MKQSRPEVFKFGGVAVGNADAIRIALAHVRRAAPGVAVVVSAMNGITDLLLEAGQAALRQDRARCEEAGRRRSISVGIEAVPDSSPLAHLRGTDNQVAIYSKRYKTNPLVVTGPGAGAMVTAAGVLNDIVAIAMEERRRRTR
ncbi:MAG: hypothetical protein M3P29_00815 [Acidobacteriota bacterium]|nr:hypothetical protein [Acidobacteriota bacterium]